MGRFCLVTKNRELSNFAINKKLGSIEVCKSFSVSGMALKEYVIYDICEINEIGPLQGKNLKN